MVLLRQVDDILYTGTNEMLQKFEHFFKTKVHVGTWCNRQFTFNGVEVKQLEDYTILLSQSDLVRSLQEVSLTKGLDPQAEASPANLTSYQSALGKLLWIGHNSVPYACCVASIFARRTGSLKISDILALNKEIRYIRTLSGVLTFQSLHNSAYPIALSFSDASSKIRNTEPRAQMGLSLIHI